MLLIQVHLALSNHFMAQKVLYATCIFTNHMQSVCDLENFLVNDRIDLVLYLYYKLHHLAIFYRQHLLPLIPKKCYD